MEINNFKRIHSHRFHKLILSLQDLNAIFAITFLFFLINGLGVNIIKKNSW